MRSEEKKDEGQFGVDSRDEVQCGGRSDWRI
jgi:hypothetical protein